MTYRSKGQIKLFETKTIYAKITSFTQCLGKVAIDKLFITEYFQ